MTRRNPTLALIVSTAALVAAASSAAPSVQVTSDKEGARLTVAGKLVAVFRKPNGSLSARARADLAAQRLTDAIGSGIQSRDITTRSLGERCGIYASGTLLMVATPAEAAARGEKPTVTAARWAANLRAALGAGGAAEAGKSTAPARPDPALGAGSRTVTVPVGEARVFTFEGAGKGAVKLQAVLPMSDCVAARVVPGRPAVEIRGVEPGSAVLSVTRGTQRTLLTVRVAKPAGRIAAGPAAQVTGASTPAALVRKAAEECALEAVEREPGAAVKIAGQPQGVQALGQGQTATVAVPITVSGEGYLPVRTVARVRVTNVALPSEEARVLLYSNDPESVREYGTLYEGLIDQSGPARLLYHHQNRMGRTFAFQIYLVNPNKAPVDVQVVEGEAGPYIDPLQAGHRAGQRYLAAASRDIGYITRVPARGCRLVYLAQVPQLQTVSGIYSFRPMSGGPIVAHVRATSETSPPEVTDDLVAAARSEPHTYPSPKKDEKYTYTVGEHWAFVPMGRRAISGRSTNRKLFGNYGVLYNITVDINNPTDTERTVRVLLTPEAGWARGVFLIEGKLVEAPQVAPPGEAVLWSGKLAAGEQRRVTITGIPVGGSAYPVSLVVRS
jgi:hypothetical protein